MDMMNSKQLTLVADSGSTKTDWMVAETGQTFHTEGLNPVLMSEEDIVGILQQEPPLEEDKTGRPQSPRLRPSLFSRQSAPPTLQKERRGIPVQSAERS